jgi:WD40 repeat protein
MKQKRKLMMRFSPLVLSLTLLICIFISSSPPNPKSSAQDSSTSSELPSDLAPISVWNVNDIEQLAVMGRGTPLHAEWSPDGEWFVVQTSIGVWIYPEDDLDSPPRQLAADYGPILTFTFHPDSHQIATAHPDGEVVVWNIEMNTINMSFDTTQIGLSQLVYAPNGNRLATISARPYQHARNDQRIILWDMTASQPIIEIFNGTNFTPQGAVFSADSSVMVTSLTNLGHAWEEGLLQWWDTESGDLLRTEENVILDVQATPDGRYLVGEAPYQYLLQMIDLSTSETLNSPFLGDGWLEGRPFALTQNRIFIISRRFDEESETRIVELATYDLNSETFVVETGVEYSTWHISVHPDEHVVSMINSNGTIKHWDMNAHEWLSENSHFLGPIGAIAIVSDDSIVTGAGDFLSFWNMQTGDRQDRRGLGGIVELDLSNDGQWLLIGSGSGQIHRMQISDRSITHTFDIYDARLTALAISHDEKYIVTGGSDRIEYNARRLLSVWEITSNQDLVQTSEVDSDDIAYELTYSPNDDLIGMGTDRGAYIWHGVPVALGYKPNMGNTFASRLEQQIETDGYSVVAVEFTADSTYMVAGESIRPDEYHAPSGNVYIIDVETEQVIGELRELEDQLTDVAVSPDGSIIAVSDLNEVTLWSMRTRELIQTLPIGGSQLEFSDDGRLLVIASEGTVQLWGVPEPSND